MSSFRIRNPDYVAVTRQSFAQQQAMATIGATLRTVEPGECKIEIPYNRAFTQQHGFMHAGIIGTVLDSACGYAAYTLMPVGADVLSVEYKIQLLRPAKGDRFVAHGRVVRAGSTVTATAGDVIAYDGETQRHIATMTATMVTLLDREGLTG